MDLGRFRTFFDLSRIGQGMEFSCLPLTVGLENAADFDNAVPVDVQAGGFQINKD